MGKTIIKLTILLLWSVLLIFIFHSRAARSELRYTRVAEGNISQGVHLILKDGIQGYATLLHNDAETWGRIRPLHNLYYCVPFALTMIRNGDLFYQDPDVPIEDRINGDLQTHVAFLFASLALAVSILSWLVWRITGAWWYALLLPLYAVPSLMVCENLLVNFSDGGEIGQLLLISLYLAFMAKLFMGEMPGRWAEGGAVLFLLLAYAMKETTIILLPVMLLILAWRYFRTSNDKSACRSFIVRHALLHVLLASALLSAVYLYRAGEYVSTNYSITSDLWSRLAPSLRIMSLAAPVLPLILIGGLFAVIASVVCTRKFKECVNNACEKCFASTECVIVAIGIPAGLWAINLPWSGMLVKYYLPVYVIACLAALLIQALVQQLLWRCRYSAASILWIVGTFVFMTQDLPWQRETIKTFYSNNYEYRKSVSVISKDIIDCFPEADTQCQVHIVDGGLFQEGALPFCRQLNRYYEVNVMEAGKAVYSINACEKNYFRRYPGRPAVELTLSEELPVALDVNDVYLLGNVVKNERQQLEQMGYQFSSEMSAAISGVRVVKYIKRLP